jgi:glycosyltransferase involved in cell wall biosynthesis
MPSSKILIDAREFTRKRTGISRFVEGLASALLYNSIASELILTVTDIQSVPRGFKKSPSVKIIRLPNQYLLAEMTLMGLSQRGLNLYISPYPKLPLFGCYCSAVNTIHDVLDLTHPAYSKRSKAYIDRLRLRQALIRSKLTWYDSEWSMKETARFAGITGKNPRVRYLGIGNEFIAKETSLDNGFMQKYGIKKGYVLILGNGLPHKNLGVILSISEGVKRDIVIVGAHPEKKRYWIQRYPETSAFWIDYVEEDDLPAIIKNAFCLAQPSMAEGYGYPPLEAMACGVPAVVSNIPVLVETTGGNAFSADPNEPKEWLEAFEALENNDINIEQVDKGLKWVKQFQGRDAWQKHIADIEELMG